MKDSGLHLNKHLPLDTDEAFDPLGLKLTGLFRAKLKMGFLKLILTTYQNQMTIGIHAHKLNRTS